MNWLEDHIENFVKPAMGDWFCDIDEELSKPLGYFAPEELTVIKNTWRSIKKAAKGRQILLPGRDVFVFEILARREGYPTIFMPECSRQTVSEIARDLGPMRHCFLFDTGFAGSIPRNLKIKNFELLSCNYFDGKSVGVQVFPRLTFSRGLALKIEKTPKYWESGRLANTYTTGSNAYTYYVAADNANGVSISQPTFNYSRQDKIIQPYSRREEFIKAARLTIEVYKNSSPRFVNHHVPISTHEGW